MSKLARFIECELDRNMAIFAKFNGGLLSSFDFIENFLLKKDCINLDEEERKYVMELKILYKKLIRITDEVAKIMVDYKEAYIELFSDELIENRD